MSRAAQKLISASGGKAYEIEQSLMFGEDANSYIYKNYGSAGTSRKTWTFSAWVKRSHVQTGHADSSKGNILFSAWDDSTNTDTEYFALNFYADKIYIGGYNTNWRITNRLFRDATSWFHLCLAIDTTQSTANDRVKLYINGVQETSFGTTNNPTQDSNTGIGSATWTLIGAINATGTVSWYKGYVAEVHYVDGTALTPSSFGETDAVTGQWIPKKYTGSYGNNGVYLKLASGAIGTDSSGNGNTWSTSSMGNSDVLLDTPTNNYCTLNRNQAYNSDTGTLSQGALFLSADTYTSGHYSNISSTFNVPASGKWYVECRVSIEGNTGNAAFFGVVDQDIDWNAKGNENLAGADGLFNSLYLDYIKVLDSGILGTGNTSATATSYILGMALDVDNGYAYFGVDNGSAMVWYKNDGSTSGGDPTSGSTGTGGFARTFTTNDTITVSTAIGGSNSYGSQNHLNFGQNGTFCGTETAGGNTDGNGEGNFFRSPPSGYLALCSKNLPTPAIKKSSNNFNTVLYTGNGGTNAITGVGHQPDLVWIKDRSASTNHGLHDSVRANRAWISTNSNAAESAGASYVSAFGSDGFTANANTAGNASSNNYVAWCWKAGGSSSTNNDGAEASTVSVNTTAGFSIIQGEGTGSSTTYGHGLGVVPKVYIVKLISDTGDWYLQTSALDGGWDYIQLNATGASASMTATAPTSSVIYSNATDGEDFLIYAFAEVEGFSKFGSYTGNGESENGPYVFTGFSPALVIIKESSGTGGSWFMWDNKRETFNVRDLVMWADAINQDTSHDEYEIDFLSNGFKIRGNSAATNQDGETMFYMAFAEFPAKYANAR